MSDFIVECVERVVSGREVKLEDEKQVMCFRQRNLISFAGLGEMDKIGILDPICGSNGRSKTKAFKKAN